jgi:hypothetical protein
MTSRSSPSRSTTRGTITEGRTERRTGRKMRRLSPIDGTETSTRLSLPSSRTHSTPPRAVHPPFLPPALFPYRSTSSLDLPDPLVPRPNASQTALSRIFRSLLRLLPPFPPLRSSPLLRPEPSSRLKLLLIALPPSSLFSPPASLPTPLTFQLQRPPTPRPQPDRRTTSAPLQHLPLHCSGSRMTAFQVLPPPDPSRARQARQSRSRRRPLIGPSRSRSQREEPIDPHLRILDLDRETQCTLSSARSSPSSYGLTVGLLRRIPSRSCLCLSC